MAAVESAQDGIADAWRGERLAGQEHAPPT
jgi:hypothetical protein